MIWPVLFVPEFLAPTIYLGCLPARKRCVTVQYNSQRSLNLSNGFALVRRTFRLYSGLVSSVD